MRKSSGKIIFLSILVLGLAISILLVQQKQSIRSHAAPAACPGIHQTTYQGVYRVNRNGNDFEYLANHGINWMEVRYSASNPQAALSSLNLAADLGMKIVVGLTIEDTFGSSTFSPNSAYSAYDSFFNYTIPTSNKYAGGKAMKYHPAILANYAYSMNHWVLDQWAHGNRLQVLTTTQRQEVWQRNKEITMRDDGTWVPILVHYRSARQMEAYNNRNGDGVQREFAANEADIALLHDYTLYPTHEGDSDSSTGREEETQLFYERERDYIVARDPNTKIHMLLGAIGANTMPNFDQMLDWSCRISQSGGAEAIAWYVWDQPIYGGELNNRSNNSYVYADLHCALYNIASRVIPGWLAQHTPQVPSGCSLQVDPGTGATPTPPGGNYNQADINRDGRVNLLDYVLLFENFGTTGSNQADLNNDNRVNLLDYVILFENFGRTS